MKYIGLLMTIMIISCTTDNNSTTQTVTDITDAIFQNRNATCDDYVNQFKSNVLDVGQSTYFTGAVTISIDNNKCQFSSNSIPNHNFNDGPTKFANDVDYVESTYSITSMPSVAESITDLSIQYDNAIFLNGAKLDLIAAACKGVDDEKKGCGADKGFDEYWRFDPMFSGNNFGTDTHNAHAQPNGAYHYHGDPKAMYDTSGKTESPLIGFAADGFPIYGPYISDNGSIRKVNSCYQLKSGARVALSNQAVGAQFNPGGNYDGTYIQDYEYNQAALTAGTCDLDECNGMTRNNIYGYYVTDSYPWVLKCFKGTPDQSFRKN